MSRALALIETSGNQAFIFGTNRLREQIGASELIRRIGTTFVKDFCAKAGGAAQPIFTASGKAVVKCNTKKLAQDLVQAVTLRALKEAPGVDVQGVVHEIAQGQKLHEAATELFRKLDNVRGSFRSLEHRFQRLPPVRDCERSGLPAETLRRYGDSTIVNLAAVSRVKEDLRDESYDRMTAALRGDQVPAIAKRFADVLEDSALSTRNGSATGRRRNAGDGEGEAAEDTEWIAVVHADGSGLGKIFQSGAARLPPIPINAQ